MLYSFDDANAAERHTTQYFEMFGNRGIYHNGWTAVTKHRTPWAPQDAKVPAFDDDVWELYSDKDWTQANNLAKRDAGEAPRTAAPVADRGDALQGAAAGRPVAREDEPGHRRSADPHQGKDPTALSAAWADCWRTACSASRTSRTRSRPKSWCRRRAPRASSSRRARTSAAGASTPTTASSSTATTGAVSRHFFVESDQQAPRGPASGADGVRLRRRRTRQGGQGDLVRGRQEGRRRRHRCDAGDGLLRRRRLRCRRGFRRPGLTGLRPDSATPSTARSEACSSRSPTTRTITWSPRRTPSGPRWDDSNARIRQPKCLDLSVSAHVSGPFGSRLFNKLPCVRRTIMVSGVRASINYCQPPSLRPHLLSGCQTAFSGTRGSDSTSTHRSVSVSAPAGAVRVHHASRRQGISPDDLRW